MASGLTELGLSRRPASAAARGTRDRDLLDRLSAVLHKATIDSRRLQSRAFLAQIEEFRRRLDEVSRAPWWPRFPTRATTTSRGRAPTCSSASTSTPS